MRIESPATARELYDRLSLSLVALRGFDWEALPLRAHASPDDLGAWDGVGVRRVVDQALAAVDAVHTHFAAVDEIAGTAFLLRFATAQALEEASSKSPNVLRLIELVSSAEHGLSQLLAMIASRVGGSGSVAGHSEVARALRNRQALSELKRIVTPGAASRDACDVRARRAGNAISKALGASGAALLPIAPRMHLREMRSQLNGLLAEQESEDRTTSLERMLVDCGSAVDILAQDVNVQLRDHDNAIIESVRGAIVAGEPALGARYLKAMAGRSAELDALAAVSPLPGELVLDLLAELWTSSEVGGGATTAEDPFGASWLPPEPHR